MLDPRSIRYVSLQYNPKKEVSKSIAKGNWDSKISNFRKTQIFSSINEVFEKNIPLAQTKYFKKMRNAIEAGNDNRGCKTLKHYNEKYKKLESVFEHIKKEYNPARIESPILESFPGKIVVAVGRNGEFILLRGHEYLALAIFLRLKSVPVQLEKRHYNWARFRKELYLHSQLYPKGIYQPLLHPDLEKIPHHRKGEEDRWALINKNLPFIKGTVLDIGSNLGYFCHKFEELGFECYALEKNYKYLYFLKKLRDFEHKKFKVLSKSVFDIKTKKYDIVLALSIFHHFLRTKKLYNKMTKFLDELDMKIMFFEPHETGHGFKHAYIDYSEIEFVNYILENSCLNNYKFLGRGERGRALYLLS
jgi:2-polyprenyl-3-methyl-5-hydroxy-6-metoxy-1,4-benzoquinol methylase